MDMLYELQSRSAIALDDTEYYLVRDPSLVR